MNTQIYCIIVIFLLLLTSGCITGDPYLDREPYTDPSVFNVFTYSDDHKLLQNEVINRTVKFPNGYYYTTPIEMNSTYKIYIITNERGGSVSGWYEYYVNQSTTDRFGTQYNLVNYFDGVGEANDVVTPNWTFTVPNNTYNATTYQYKPKIVIRTTNTNKNANFNITLIKL